MPRTTRPNDERSGPGLRTTTQYWNQIWKAAAPSTARSSQNRILRHHGRRRLQEYVSGIILKYRKEHSTLLEAGCANSSWLPFCAESLGLKVSGLDYSPVGCAHTRMILKQRNIPGEVYEADLFDPPQEILGRYDFVTSFGLVEHFDDTAACIAALSRFLKPGGVIITEIPNLSGMLGDFQKALDPETLNKHVRLSVADLRDAHRAAGLEVLDARYLLPVGFGVLNVESLPPDALETRLKKGMIVFLQAFTLAIWAFDAFQGPLHAGASLAPYAFCSARLGTSQA